jgi:hypothetical protein
MPRLRTGSGGAETENWTRTNPLRLKCLRFAGLFALKSPSEARLPDPDGPNRKP